MMWVTGDKRCRGRNMAKQPFAFIACARRSSWQARVNLHNPAPLWQPAKPALDKCLFRHGPSTANREYHKFHLIISPAGALARIRSNIRKRVAAVASAARVHLQHPATAALAADGDDLLRPVIGPHPLEPVKFTNLGAEQVDDDIVGVDQHPVGLPHTFQPEHLHPGFL